jgi:hypothetical protein
MPLFANSILQNMALYVASLLKPFFDEVREALLHNPMAGERLISVIRCEAISSRNPIKDLRPLTYLALSNAAILERLNNFTRTSFPEPRLSALMHVPPYYGTVGKEFERFSIIIHGRISEAIARETVIKPSKKPRDLLHFLIIVIIVHEFAHIVRSFFHGRALITDEINDHPYAVEFDNLFELRFPEAGFEAEQALFGGTIGVVFEDEIDEERPTFFAVNYNRISHLFLQCADGKAYRLGEWYSTRHPLSFHPHRTHVL